MFLKAVNLYYVLKQYYSYVRTFVTFILLGVYVYHNEASFVVFFP